MPPALWLRDKISELVEKRTTEKVFLNNFFYSWFKKLMRMLSNKSNRKDYIQLLLDAQTNTNEIEKFEDDSIDLTSINLNKKLSAHVNF